MAAIRVYMIPTCQYCTMAKDWLREQDCDFEELDITSMVASYVEKPSL